MGQFFLVFICAGEYNIVSFKKGEGISLTNADEYIQKFKELEAVVREAYGLNDWDSITGYLSKKDEYRPFRDELKYCQDVRNLLQHRQKFGSEYPIQPSREMIEFLENTINSFKNRKKCSEIMIPKSTMFCKKLGDKLCDALPKMKNASFSHVPVLDEKGVLVGVFTAFSFFNLVAERDEGEKIRNKTFKEVEEYIALDYHRSVAYCFVSRDLYVDELKDLFEKTYSGGKRLAMVFVTQHGKPGEKILGIISPWDVLGKE